jgi:hypothetical protein
MKVKFKATPDGEVAIVPRAEYERLKALEQEAQEDAGTARLVSRAKREVADGAPVLPKAVVDRLANGENPIRVLGQEADPARFAKRKQVIADMKRQRGQH